MTTLRTAAQQALDYWQQVAWGDAVMVDKMDALSTALAQEQAEPVQCNNTFGCRCPKHFVAEQAEPVQEPVAYRHLHEDGWEYFDAPTGEDCAGCQALYITPPKLVPLTDGELMGAYIDFDRTSNRAWSRAEYLLHLCRAIERALEEKNRGR